MSKDCVIPLFEGNYFEFPLFMQTSRSHGKKFNPVGITRTEKLYRCRDRETIYAFTVEYNKQFNIDCFDQDLYEFIDEILATGDFYYLQNKNAEIVCMFGLYVDNANMPATLLGNSKLLVFTNFMFRQDKMPYLDVYSSVMGEIMYILYNNFKWTETIYYKMLFCGTSKLTAAIYGYSNEWAIWGTKPYNTDSCWLVIAADAIKRDKKGFIKQHYKSDSNRESELIQQFNQDFAENLKAWDLNMDSNNMMYANNTHVRLDYISFINAVNEMYKPQRMKVPMTKLHGHPYGIVNKEIEKYYEHNSTELPVFIDSKFNVIWGNDIYEYNIRKNKLLCDTILVNSLNIQEIHKYYAYVILAGAFEPKYRFQDGVTFEMNFVCDTLLESFLDKRGIDYNDDIASYRAAKNLNELFDIKEFIDYLCDYYLHNTKQFTNFMMKYEKLDTIPGAVTIVNEVAKFFKNETKEIVGLDLSRINMLMRDNEQDIEGVAYENI